MTLLLTPHRFSTEDYHRMVEAGVLRENARVELLDGVITDMMLSGPFQPSIAGVDLRGSDLCARGRAGHEA